MQQGQIKRIVRDRGFGFVRTQDGTEYFFHRTGMAQGTSFDELNEGQDVTFDTEPSSKGPRACQLRG